MFLKDNLNLDEESYLKREDIYGKTAEFYIKEKRWSLDE
jgi:hypothetical protein